MTKELRVIYNGFQGFGNQGCYAFESLDSQSIYEWYTKTEPNWLVNLSHGDIVNIKCKAHKYLDSTDSFDNINHNKIKNVKFID